MASSSNSVGIEGSEQNPVASPNSTGVYDSDPGLDGGASDMDVEEDANETNEYSEEDSGDDYYEGNDESWEDASNADNDSNVGESELAVNFIKFDEERCHPQTDSILFNSFPGEIRDLIFYYALCDYEDTSKLYDENTCYRRPGYFAPRRTDTALLGTCQRIYREAWFLPWTTREHTMFLAADDRVPVHNASYNEMRETLKLVNAIHGKTEIDHIRIFPQLYRLEPGVELQRINEWRHFHPRRFTITIRHTDWWFWEADEPLKIGSRFVTESCFPSSVKELCLELESLERRKEQINSIAKLMIDNWHFHRNDGLCLSAKDSAISVTRWSGSSTWGGKRWIRDEARPDELDYYVASIVFKPTVLESCNKEVHTGHNCSQPLLRVSGFTPFNPPKSTIPESILKLANIPPGTPAEEVRRIWQSFNLSRG